jgi:hypothetical protein
VFFQGERITTELAEHFGVDRKALGKAVEVIKKTRTAKPA